MPPSHVFSRLNKANSFNISLLGLPGSNNFHGSCLDSVYSLSTSVGLEMVKSGHHIPGVVQQCRGGVV